MLEKTLELLAQFGKPRISKHDRGWTCAVDMFVAGKGIAFEVKSDCDHPTPIEAAHVCEERLRLVLAQLTTQAPAIAG